MIVLKIIGWILLSLIALIIIALCIKVKISAEYSDDNTNIMLQWLFLKIPLYPPKPKQPAADTQPAEAAAQEQPADTPGAEEAPAQESAADTPAVPEKKQSLIQMLYNSHGVDGIIAILKKVFSHIGTFTGDLCKSLIIDELYIDIGCTKKDAASTAVYYGEVCSLVFPVLGAIAAKYKIKKYDVNVYPDFLAKFSRASFYIRLHIYPIYLTGISLALVFKLIFRVALGVLLKLFLPGKKNKAGKQNIDNKEKSEDSNERTVSGRDTVNND